MRIDIALAIALLSFLCVGCGGASAGRTDVPQDSLEVQYGKTVKGMVRDLQRSLQSEGIEGVKSEIVGIVENLAEYEDDSVGEHKDTAKKIYEGAQQLQKLVEGSPSSAAVQQKIDELAQLAATLPGELPPIPAPQAES